MSNVSAPDPDFHDGSLGECAFGSMTPVTAQGGRRTLGQGNAAQFVGEDRFKGTGAALDIAKSELSDC